MTEGILGGRQAATVLTRATWTSGAIFMVLALVLSIMSSRAQQPESVIQVQTPATAPAPEPVLPGIGDAPGGTGNPPTETPPPNPGGPGN